MDQHTPFSERLHRLPGDLIPSRHAISAHCTECPYPGCGDTDRTGLLGGAILEAGGTPAVLACLTCPSGHYTLLALYVHERTVYFRRTCLDDAALDRLEILAQQKGLVPASAGEPCTCRGECLLLQALLADGEP